MDYAAVLGGSRAYRVAGYGGGEFPSVQDYKNLRRWVTMIGRRPR